MSLSEILKTAMVATQTPARLCADALGLSPQNFGQKLKRDTLSLNDVMKALAACKVSLRIGVIIDGEEKYCYESYYAENTDSDPEV